MPATPSDVAALDDGPGKGNRLLMKFVGMNVKVYLKEDYNPKEVVGALLEYDDARLVLIGKDGVQRVVSLASMRVIEPV